MDIERILNYVDTMEALCEKIRQELSDGKPVVRVSTGAANVSVRQDGRVKLGDPPPRKARPSHPPVQLPPRPEQTLDLATRIINNPGWPPAVPPDLLCEPTESDLTARAEIILDTMLDSNPAGVRFLDFGCGLGYTTRRVLERGVASATGYDVEEQGWDRFRDDRLAFTTDAGPLEPGYDMVLAFDVLDHCERPLEALRTVSRLLAPGGVAYVRCHPWASRTGGHLYQQVNKAYLHLAVDDSVLERLGYRVSPVKKIRRPLGTYREWFAAAQFLVRNERKHVEVMENYLKDDRVAHDTIFRHWDIEQVRDPTFVESSIVQVLELQFVDYVLQKAP